MDMPGQPGSRCLNGKLYGEDLCNELLDSKGDHAVCCECGPCRNDRHDELVEVYADIMEEAGAHARREVFVQEFSGNARDAFLDTWGFGTPELPDCLVDVTVRHPFAERYQPAASRTAGSAAQQAEKEKQDKYPPTGGRYVTAAAHETWGRLGQVAENLLAHCAAAARCRVYRRGRAPGNYLRRWRAQLDAALMRGISAQLAASRFGIPGRACRHVRREDARQLEARCGLGM